MKPLSLGLQLLLATFVLGQSVVTEYITVEPSTSASIANAQATQSSAATTSPLTSSATDSSSLSPSSTDSSDFQATQSQAMATPTASSAPVYNGGTPGSGNQVDNNAGASGGTSGSFNLSKGGMVAIIVVVVLVAIFGSKSDPVSWIEDKVVC